MWGITASKTSASFALKCGFFILLGTQERRVWSNTLFKPYWDYNSSFQFTWHHTTISGMTKSWWNHVPFYVTHEDSDEVKNLLQTFRRSLQSVVSKSTQEDEKISQVLCKELWKKRDKDTLNSWLRWFLPYIIGSNFTIFCSIHCT